MTKQLFLLFIFLISLQSGNEFNPLQITGGGVDINSTYEYQFLINENLSDTKGEKPGQWSVNEKKLKTPLSNK